MKPNPEITKWITEHKVCWELFPYFILVGDQTVEVGFELYLYAQHADSVRADPGCNECRKLYDRLQELAVLTLPQEHRPTRYEIEPFDSSFHIRPETKLKTEVQLKMLIIHREDFLRPVDNCERKCVKEIQQNLAALGVQPRIWSQSRISGT